MFFKSKYRPNVAINSLFDQAGVYFIKRPAGRDLNQQLQAYVRELMRSGLIREVGIVLDKSALVPYLSVRSNLFIQGRVHDLDLLPREMRNDVHFLEEKAADLGELQRIYVEFFRSVLSGKRYVLMTDVLAKLSSPEGRQMLEVFRHCVRQLGVSLILFTSDATLLRDNPQSSLQTPPPLTVDSKQQELN
ncbi:hypothetical protein [Lacticaseibacillus zhaodongensis]|uniref:hypothetical protein n=1 Tax=Lacticaseibacillus zhaodongensis TaxID=2668065 RepID=UPI0012D2DDE5|nr:hypothetical protein [Lacticaseibacillus zhaodongensis]